jgi:beta-mannosidase
MDSPKVTDIRTIFPFPPVHCPITIVKSQVKIHPSPETAPNTNAPDNNSFIMSTFSSTNLSYNWEFKQIGAVGVPVPNDKFLPVSQFPTNIHLDLLHHDLIPDPFIGLNEYKVQWVGEQKWLYRTTFSTSPALSNQKTVLQFDGLDTFALVSLNGNQILEADNMHRTFRIDITNTMNYGLNLLEILFDSAIIRGKKLMQERDFKPAGFTSSTDKSRLLVRKAQYHYAWNWGKF